MLHNINLTIYLRQNNNKNKKMNNINSSKLRIIKNKIKEIENVKKFKTITSNKTIKLKINNKKKINLMNNNNSKKILKNILLKIEL